MELRGKNLATVALVMFVVVCGGTVAGKFLSNQLLDAPVVVQAPITNANDSDEQLQQRMPETIELKLGNSPLIFEEGNKKAEKKPEFWADPSGAHTDTHTTIDADLETIREIQLRHLIEKGFHVAANMDAGTFSQLVPLPDFSDALLVVNESFISLDKQCDLLGVGHSLDFSQHLNRVKTPSDKLYWRYGVDDGRLTLGLSADNARTSLSSQNRLPATTAEVLAIYRETPDIFRSIGIDAAGSSYADGRNPHISLYQGKPALRVALSRLNETNWGSASFER